MSPRDRALWMRFHRRANQLSPELRQALLDAYDIIRESLTPEEIERLIQGDDALLDVALQRFRAGIKASVERGFNGTVIPQSDVSVMFDYLNPKVIDAVRILDSRVINTLKDEIRETVRAYVENGIRDGKNPSATAKALRPVIGMSSTQAANAEKYRAKLVAAKLPSDTVDRRVNVYQRKAIAQNAEVNARTATVDSLKLGQKLSWQSAMDQGVIAPGTLYKKWVSVGDDRVRPEHVAMNGEIVRFENYYSNGEDVPGESVFNCRCISTYLVKKPT